MSSQVNTKARFTTAKVSKHETHRMVSANDQTSEARGLSNHEQPQGGPRQRLLVSILERGLLEDSQ